VSVVLLHPLPLEQLVSPDGVGVRRVLNLGPRRLHTVVGIAPSGVLRDDAFEVPLTYPPEQIAPAAFHAIAYIEGHHCTLVSRERGDTNQRHRAVSPSLALQDQPMPR
jgi:hypothetical protein